MTLPQMILLAFSLLYLALGVFCGFSADNAAAAMGLSWEHLGGKIEFLTFYVGLEIAFGVFFGICVWKKEWVDVALVLALISSLGLAVTRGTAILYYQEDLPSLGYTFLYFEIGMVLLAGAGVFLALRSP